MTRAPIDKSVVILKPSSIQPQVHTARAVYCQLGDIRKDFDFKDFHHGLFRINFVDFFANQNVVRENLIFYIFVLFDFLSYSFVKQPNPI